MDCQQAQKLLSAYYDDELSVDVRSSVAEHVQSCSDCSAELGVCQSMSGMTKGLDYSEPKPRYWAAGTAGPEADRE